MVVFRGDCDGAIGRGRARLYKFCVCKTRLSVGAGGDAAIIRGFRLPDGLCYEMDYSFRDGLRRGVAIGSVFQQWLGAAGAV